MKTAVWRGFGVAAAAGAVLVGVLGLVFQNQANFSNDYVKQQLTAQKITFLPVAALTSDQKNIGCLVAYAGEEMTTGGQAQCYADGQIGADLTQIGAGKTYAEISYPAKLARDEANAALQSDPTSPATQELVKKANSMDIPVEVMFRGETLRGLLLTAYGFSLLGERAQQAATTAFVVAGVLLMISALCFIVGRARSRRSLAEPLDATPAQVLATV